MSIIKIRQCSACRKNEEDLPSDKWHDAADPNCPQCRGSGTCEIDKAKRLEQDREIEIMLDKIDDMEYAEVDWTKMSCEEFEEWRRD